MSGAGGNDGELLRRWVVVRIYSKVSCRKRGCFYLKRMGVVKLESWSSRGGRVVLVEDAPYCPSANMVMDTKCRIVKGVCAYW